MWIQVKDLVPYINNWWTYSALVNKEVGFLTRIVSGYYRQEEIRKGIAEWVLSETTEWPFDIQKRLPKWTRLILRKDTTNKFDSNATEVLTEDLQFLGFLKAEIAAEIKDVNSFMVSILEPLDQEWPLKRNSHGSSISIINIENYRKASLETNKE